MTSAPGRHTRLRHALRWAMLTSALTLIALLVVAAARESFGEVRARLLLTSLGLCIGSLLADVNLGVYQRSARISAIALAAVSISQLLYLALVWTGFRTETWLWRTWWITAIAAIGGTWVLVIRRLASEQTGLVARGTPVCILAAIALVASLAIRTHLVGNVDPFLAGMITLSAAGGLVGTVTAALRWWRSKSHQPRRPMTRGAKIAWLTATHAALLVLGLYVGRAGTNAGDPIQLVPSALRRLSTTELEAKTTADLHRLTKALSEMDDVIDRAAAFQAELGTAMDAVGRGYFSPKEEETLRWQFVEFLTLRAMLLRLAAVYAGYEGVADARLRASCAVLGYAATIETFHAGLRFTDLYAQRPAVRRKLNESEPLWGLRAGLFDEVENSLLSERNLELCEEMGAYFDVHRTEWRHSEVIPPGAFDPLAARIDEARSYVAAHRISRPEAWVQRVLEHVQQDAYTPVYAAQSILAELIGDTRVVERKPYISAETIATKVAPRLEPGDILLERRNWFLSNAFLPGFWPHGALYVGTYEDLQSLGIADAPEIARYAKEFREPASDGHPHTVIEAVSEGVIFNSLAHSMHADYVAVLRPQLPPEMKAEAIKRAFTHYGKPYDFEFDFFTSDRLVCTELIYRAYEGMLSFDLIRVMGRDTLPALQIARKFATERSRKNPELSFVLFLDAVPQASTARLATDDEFCATIRRPRAFAE